MVLITGNEVVAKMKADKCLTQSRSRNGKKYHNKYTEYFGKLGYAGINKNGVFTKKYSYGVVGHCCIAVQYWLCRCGYSKFVPKSPKYLFNTNVYMKYLKKQPNGVKWTTDRKKAKVGAIAFKGSKGSKSANHTCVFLYYKGDYVYTVDFNVSDGKGHNNGTIKKRHKSYFRGFANIPYVADKPKPVSKPKYEVGKTYTLQEDMNVRVSPNKTAKLVAKSKWSKDALRHRNSKGMLIKGTRITVKEVKTVDKAIWVKSPTGWMCAVGSTGHIFIK